MCICGCLPTHTVYRAHACTFAIAIIPWLALLMQDHVASRACRPCNTMMNRTGPSTARVQVMPWVVMHEAFVAQQAASSVQVTLQHSKRQNIDHLGSLQSVHYGPTAREKAALNCNLCKYAMKRRQQHSLAQRPTRDTTLVSSLANHVLVSVYHTLHRPLLRHHCAVVDSTMRTTTPCSYEAANIHRRIYCVYMSTKASCNLQHNWGTLCKP